LIYVFFCNTEERNIDENLVYEVEIDNFDQGTFSNDRKSSKGLSAQ
jgi:hypothetical protein